MKLFALMVALMVAWPSQGFAQNAAAAAAAAVVKIEEARKALDAATALLATALPAPPAPVGTIHVPLGGNLQAALNTVKPGGMVTLAPGVYTGNFVLPAKTATSTAVITLRTLASAGMPGAGMRMDPSASRLLAKLKSPTNEPALRAAPGSHHWRIELVEFQANQGGFGDIIQLGSGDRLVQTSRTLIPHTLVLDRLYIHGDPLVGQKRGIALNSGLTSITNSYISDIKAIGQDSQAIMAWNGPGPYTIFNNYLEAAGENVMFGGGDSASSDLIPSDVRLEGNTLTKPLAWRPLNWLEKNLFEIKSGRRILILNNDLDYSWVDGQVGYAIALTPRNQDGGAPWSTVEDITIENNRIRHVAGGVQMLGRDDEPGSVSGRLQRVVIRGNTFTDMDPAWGDNGRQFFISGGPKDVTIENNVIDGANLNTFLSFDGDVPTEGLRVIGNIAHEGAYGVFLSGGTPGIKSLEAAAPGYMWSGNTIIRTNPDNAIPYPGGTTVRIQ